MSKPRPEPNRADWRLLSGFWVDEKRCRNPGWSGRPGALEAVIGSENSPQKHVWRARIVLLSADGLGTMAIQRQTGKVVRGQVTLDRGMG